MLITTLQFIALIFRNAASFCSLYLAILFFSKVKQARGSGVNLSVLFGIGWFFLFAGIMVIFHTFWLFTIYAYLTEILSFYSIGVFLGYCGIIGLVYSSEKMLGKTKYAFTFFSIISYIYGIFFINTIEEFGLYTTIAVPISLSIVLINFLYSWVGKTKGEIRKKMAGAFLSIGGVLIFYLIDRKTGPINEVISIPRQILMIISMIGITVSIIILGIIILSFETFTEFGWKEKMRELFIIGPNGAPLFHYSFIKESSFQEPDLVAVGLTGFKDVLAEMMQSKKALKVVDHQDLKIIFEYGAYSTLALVVYENLRIYHSKLAALIVDFEHLFQDVLSQWKGEVTVFLPSKRLIESTFQ